MEKLININNETIKNKFAELWLDDTILNASQKDDYLRLEEFVTELGNKFVQENYLNERNLKQVLRNMRTLYDSIKGE